MPVFSLSHVIDGYLRRVLWSVSLSRDASRATCVLAQLPTIHAAIITREQVEVASAGGRNKEWEGQSPKEHCRSDVIMAAEVVRHSILQSTLHGVILQDERSESLDQSPWTHLCDHLQATHHPHSTNLQAASSIHPEHSRRQIHPPTRWAESCPLARKSWAVRRRSQVLACNWTHRYAGRRLGVHMSTDHPQDHGRVHLSRGRAKQTVRELRCTDPEWRTSRSGPQHWQSNCWVCACLLAIPIPHNIFKTTTSDQLEQVAWQACTDAARRSLLQAGGQSRRQCHVLVSKLGLLLRFVPLSFALSRFWVSLFYSVIKLSHPLIPYQIRLDSTSHGRKDTTMLDCEWPHHPIESSHLGSCADSSSQSSPCWMYPCWFSLVSFMDAFENMKITRRELIAVHSNGIVLNCQGMFVGQLLVKMSQQANSLAVLQLALVPDLGFITAAIRELVKSNFNQCMTLVSIFIFILLLLIFCSFKFYLSSFAFHS